MKTASVRFLFFLHCLYLVQVYGDNEKISDEKSEGTQASTITIAPQEGDHEKENVYVVARNLIRFGQKRQGQQGAPAWPGFVMPTGTNFPSTGSDTMLNIPSGFGSTMGSGSPTIHMEELPTGEFNIVEGSQPFNEFYGNQFGLGTQDTSIIGNDVQNQLQVLPGESSDAIIDHLIRSRVADIQRFVLETNKFTQLLSSVALSFVSTTNMFGEIERKPFLDADNLRNIKVLVDLLRNVKNHGSVVMANLLNDITFVLNYLSTQPLFGIRSLAGEISKGLYRRLSNLPVLLLRQVLQRRLLK